MLFDSNLLDIIYFKIVFLCNQLSNFFVKAHLHVRFSKCSFAVWELALAAQNAPNSDFTPRCG